MQQLPTDIKINANGNENRCNGLLLFILSISVDFETIFLIIV